MKQFSLITYLNNEKFNDFNINEYIKTMSKYSRMTCAEVVHDSLDYFIRGECLVVRQMGGLYFLYESDTQLDYTYGRDGYETAFTLTLITSFASLEFDESSNVYSTAHNTQLSIIIELLFQTYQQTEMTCDEWRGIINNSIIDIDDPRKVYEIEYKHAEKYKSKHISPFTFLTGQTNKTLLNLIMDNNQDTFAGTIIYWMMNYYKTLNLSFDDLVALNIKLPEILETIRATHSYYINNTDVMFNSISEIQEEINKQIAIFGKTNVTDMRLDDWDHLLAVQENVANGDMSVNLYVNLPHLDWSESEEIPNES